MSAPLRRRVCLEASIDQFRFNLVFVFNSHLSEPVCRSLGEPCEYTYLVSVDVNFFLMFIFDVPR